MSEHDTPAETSMRTHWKCEACGKEGHVQHLRDVDVYSAIQVVEDAHREADSGCQFRLDRVRITEVSLAASVSPRTETPGGIACGPSGCMHMSRESVDALLAIVGEQKAKRQALMPDEVTAIRFMTDAKITLMEMGWSESMYAPKHVDLDVIECGSTGIHRAMRDEHGFWIHADNDSWPSKPVLYRLVPHV